MAISSARLTGLLWFILLAVLLFNFLYFFLASTPRRSNKVLEYSTAPPNLGKKQPQDPLEPSPIYVEAPSVFSAFPPPDVNRKDYHEWNAKTLRDLHSCVALNNCGSNQKKVALLADNWFQQAVVGDFRGGEGIWRYKNLRELGYTTLFSSNLEETLFQYRMIPDFVKVVIRGEIGRCHLDPGCVKGPNNPDGIPAWKLFDMSYWPHHRDNDPNFPMKGKWLLSANPDPDASDFESSPIQYIGYSNEDACTKISIIPLEERKNQVWMLMKQILYVYHHNFAWNRTYFSLVHEQLGVNFVGGWELNEDYLGWGKDIHEEILDIEDNAHGVYNLGIQTMETFLDQVRHSKMMIGMSNPHWSPSPIDSLCLGVPFLNPISNWNHDDPWDKSRWDTQHPTLVPLDPPFVYHVHKKNFTGFLWAVENALKTPIDRFIPDHMTEKSVKGRLEKLMETDWRVKAECVLKENKAKADRGEDSYIFEL